ncbi:MAG: Gx transporter family protein [Gammaproteobacteria bacterium]|nr:Gx transporter family protein [Gammaproteobacteria bacterium]
MTNGTLHKSQTVFTREERLIANFAALAVLIHVLEAAVPTPLPGMKPGLANIVVLIVLLRHGLRAAIWVGLLRVLVGSLIIGTFLTPTFILSLSGAIASVLVLAATYRWFRPWISPIGYGVISALAHTGAQALVAYALFIPHPAVLNLLPILMAAATLLGLFSGILAKTILLQLPAAKL